MDENMVYNQEPQNTGAPQPPQEKKGFAIASMILGIVAIVLGGCLWYISIPCAVVGLILGALSAKAKKNGMATTGIVLSIIALAWTVIALIVLGGTIAGILGSL